MTEKNDHVRIYREDCLGLLHQFQESSVDVVITDPPYHLTTKKGKTKGFMHKQWDGGHVAHDPATWAAVLRVLKPGSFCLAFGHPRTWHRLVCALENGGFTIYDSVLRLYGSGYPKSRHVLKPAWEPVCVAAKGKARGLNVESCRVLAPAGDREDYGIDGDELAGRNRNCFNDHDALRKPYTRPQAGRWPANVVHDSSEETELMFAAAGTSESKNYVARYDHGSLSRFFYCARASTKERTSNGRVTNTHSTVKPIALMRWLVRLASLPGEIVLDPFMGSGTTGLACLAEDRQFIGVEIEQDSFDTATARIQAACADQPEKN